MKHSVAKPQVRNGKTDGKVELESWGKGKKIPRIGRKYFSNLESQKMLTKIFTIRFNEAKDCFDKTVQNRCHHKF